MTDFCSLHSSFIYYKFSISFALLLNMRRSRCTLDILLSSINYQICMYVMYSPGAYKGVQELIKLQFLRSTNSNVNFSEHTDMKWLLFINIVIIVSTKVFRFIATHIRIRMKEQCIHRYRGIPCYHMTYWHSQHHSIYKVNV